MKTRLDKCDFYSCGYRSAFRHFGPIAILSLLLFSGCADPKGYQLGQAAERRGDAHVAYDYYYRTLQASPSDGAARSALARVAPTAAQYWYAEALAAANEGRPVDAWRQAMRCLDICPDHPKALELIRTIEAEHPNEIASVQKEYQRRGLAALPASKSTTFASGNRPRRESPPVTLPLAPTVVDKVEPPAPEPEPEPPPEKATQDAAVHEHVSADEFSVTRTLSKRDRRYRGMDRAIDGVSIKLKDTDDDGEAEFDLYLGGRRFAKVRDFKEGETRRFRGRSGKSHELKLLHVEHRTHTATVQICPVPS